jgi:hypothetical protein
MTTRNLVVAFISFLLFGACSKNNSTGLPTNPNGNTTNAANTYKPGKSILVDDLVLYTADGAHRDVQMIRDFVTRNFPEYVNTFDYGQTSVSYNNDALSLVFLDNNRVKLKDTVMEIIKRTDTEMLLSPLDSADMPSPESQWLGHCMLLHEQVPQYNPYSICNAAGGNCKKYRPTYPVIISGNDYYLPVLKYCLVSNCSILAYSSAPMPNYFNKNVLNGMLQNKDSVLVQVCRIPLKK